MTFDEILTAIAQDVELERECRPNSSWCEWRTPTSKTQALAWLLSDSERTEKWRRKQPKSKPVPPGDLTYEEAVELSKQGVKLQRYSEFRQAWADSSANDGGNPVNFISPNQAYRRKPTPRMVPLGPEDVPPGSVIGLPGCSGWASVVHVSRSGLVIACSDGSPLVHAFSYLITSGVTISRDGGKTWTRCEKEEVVK